jgi:2-polyprenyl-3-methyl-5-hydroxy-6-metoxy-1,4-benzoquinol methylase
VKEDCGMVLDEHYANPKLADIYDVDSGWDEGRDFYLSLAPSHPIDILDLGCGTGLLCDAYAAQGHYVTGIDPAQSMLNVARKKPQGKNIQWVCATAQEFRSERRFDLIIMTGHAFQVFLKDHDITAVFRTMHDHLKPDGRVVFETRNPEIDWAMTWDKDFNTSTCRRLEVVSHDDDTMTFDMHYHINQETITSRSTLRFLSRTEIEKHLTMLGLKVSSVKGDWHGGAFDANTSLEMIFEVHLA